MEAPLSITDLTLASNMQMNRLVLRPPFRLVVRGVVFAALMILVSSVVGQQTVAPQFALKDLNGSTVRLRAYRGKVVLINFWATWCPPCRAEMPDLVRLQREHARHGLQIIGITYPPEIETRVRRFARSLKVNYPIILGTRQIKARFSSEETLPLTVVIDRDGKVNDIISGILLRQEFDEKIKPLLMKNTEGEKRNAKSDNEACSRCCPGFDRRRDYRRSVHQDRHH